MKNYYLILLLVFCLFLPPLSMAEATDKKNTEVKSTVVRTAMPVRDVAQKWVDCSGFTAPQTRYRVTSEIVGIYAGIVAEAGDRIKQGELLAKITNPAMETRLNRAKARLSQREADYRRAHAILKEKAALDVAAVKRELAVARAELRRCRSDHQSKANLRTKGMLSENELETSLSLYEKAEAHASYLEKEVNYRENLFAHQDWLVDLENASSEVTVAQADYRDALEDVKRLTITSKITGGVSKRFVEPGQSIAPGTLLFEVIDCASLFVDCYMAETASRQIKVGQVAEIYFEDGSWYPSKVERVAPEMDREKGGFLVRLTLEPEKECLRSGCYAKVRVLVEEKKNALFVPRTVLLERGNITSLFQLSGEIALEKQVVTGISEMNRLEIISGVDVTQPIISEGIHELQDGDTVRVLEQDK